MKNKQQAPQESDLPIKLSAPAHRALAAARIRRLKDLTKHSEKEISQLHGIGPNALEQLCHALDANNLSFAKEKKSKAESKKAPAPISNTQQVDEFMDKLDHPFRAKVQQVREIILNVNKNITEQIKWNAPSFSYNGYMATFNLWAKQHVHLIFHNGAILIDSSGLLEGDYPDRRMVYFSDMNDVKSKKAALEKMIKQWIKLMDQ